VESHHYCEGESGGYRYHGMSFSENKPPGEYAPFSIYPFQCSDKEDVNRRLASLPSQSNRVNEGDGREEAEEDDEEYDDEKDFGLFDEEDSEEV
jgi:hypothetical protein